MRDEKWPQSYQSDGRTQRSVRHQSVRHQEDCGLRFYHGDAPRLVAREVRLRPKRKGPAQWPVPPLALAFGNNWRRRRRGFALAVIRARLRIARSDAEES